MILCVHILIKVLYLPLLYAVLCIDGYADLIVLRKHSSKLI